MTVRLRPILIRIHQVLKSISSRDLLIMFMQAILKLCPDNVINIGRNGTYSVTCDSGFRTLTEDQFLLLIIVTVTLSEKKAALFSPTI